MDTETQPDVRLTMLRALRGSPLSLIFAMVLWPARSLTATTLATLTGYDRGTVTAGLTLLAEMNLAQHHGRQAGWLLTTNARQLMFSDEPASNAGKNPAFLGSSSLYYAPEMRGNSPHSLDTTTTTTPHDAGENPAITQTQPTPEQTLITYLLNHGASPKAAATAAHSGYNLQDQLQLAQAWIAYARTARGRTISNPGALTAARLRTATPPPGHVPEPHLTHAEYKAQLAEWGIES